MSTMPKTILGWQKFALELVLELQSRCDAEIHKHQEREIREAIAEMEDAE